MAKDLVVNNFPILRRVRLLDWEVSAAGKAAVKPVWSAVQHDRHIKAYYQHLLDMGKLPLQACCAVMRKLLHAIHGMLKHDKPFDNTRFYVIPSIAE